MQKTISISLACIEGVVRSWIALVNAKSTPELNETRMEHKRECLYGIMSLVRLANLALHTDSGKYKALLIALLLADVIFTAVNGHAWYDYQPTPHPVPEPNPLPAPAPHPLPEPIHNPLQKPPVPQITTAQHLKQARDQRPEKSGAKLAPFNHDAFYHVCEALLVEQQRPTSQPIMQGYDLERNIDRLCQQHHIAPFFAYQCPNLRRHYWDFQQFWRQHTADNNPLYGHNPTDAANENIQSVKAFCEEFRVYCEKRAGEGGSVVERFRPIRYQPSPNQHNASDDDCPSCSETLINKNVVICDTCNKAICANCAMTWYTSHHQNECTLCRQRIVED